MDREWFHGDGKCQEFVGTISVTCSKIKPNYRCRKKPVSRIHCLNKGKTVGYYCVNCMPPARFFFVGLIVQPNCEFNVGQNAKQSRLIFLLVMVHLFNFIGHTDPIPLENICSFEILLLVLEDSPRFFLVYKRSLWDNNQILEPNIVVDSTQYGKKNDPNPSDAALFVTFIEV
jgi:hypothetical protein